MTDDPVTVFHGDRLRAYYFPGHSGRLMVTFDFRQTNRAGFRPPNYSTGFARMGHAQLSIRSAQNDWFINPDTPALEAAISTLAADHTRVGLLGYSMGGFGALRFARSLQADSAVLISPQSTIDRALAPWETRYPAESASFDPVLGDLRPRGHPPLRGLILIDPFVARDLAHARAIMPLFPGLSVLRLPFGGHPATGVLIDTAKVWLIQQAAAADRADPARLRAAHRAGRRQSPRYWQRLATQADALHGGLAAQARARAAALPPPGPLRGG
jgi:hypothetical protein